MRSIINWLAVLFLTAGIQLPAAAAGKDLNVVHSGKWPPYADASLPGQGLAVELVTTALKRAGYTTYMRIDSLDRILEGGAIGVYDVFATPWYSSARNRYMHFSKPYLESYIRFIKKKETDFIYESFDDLKGMMIGVIQGYAYDEQFVDSRELIKISERNLIQNLLKLIQGRIDLTLDDELVLQYEVNQYIPNSMKDLEFLPKPLAVRGIHISVSRENPDHDKIIAAFNKSIDEMRKDGSYDTIIAKHHVYIQKPVK
ncbi:ABC-type amino acid transport/signal transduction system, periplasmic component/domain [hydrothermal vent metagenome]|uniref:ABC-type amino acid transport/signal transduction system, periplasmic component/domain n=1 Tax=hydrothermal vent metagenome TaxID=652676 RepID=A0A3B0Z576_9ZZZZ